MSELGAEALRLIVFGAIMLSVVLIEQNRHNPEESYRQGYIDALDNVTRRLVDECLDEDSKRHMENIYNDFLKPEYESKTATCKYSPLPWYKRPKRNNTQKVTEDV